MNQVKFASNYIEGTAKTEGNELLVLSLPYSEGWSVQIDGKEANLLNVNTMWTGVYLKEQGVHKYPLPCPNKTNITKIPLITFVCPMLLYSVLNSFDFAISALDIIIISNISINKIIYFLSSLFY